MPALRLPLSVTRRPFLPLPSLGLLTLLLTAPLRPAQAAGTLLLLDDPPAESQWAGGLSWRGWPRAPGSSHQRQGLMPALDYSAPNGFFLSTDTGVGWNLAPALLGGCVSMAEIQREKVAAYGAEQAHGFVTRLAQAKVDVRKSDVQAIITADAINQPLLWAGLLAALLGWTLPLQPEVDRGIRVALLHGYAHPAWLVEREAFAFQAQPDAVPRLLQAFQERCPRRHP